MERAADQFSRKPLPSCSRMGGYPDKVIHRHLCAADIYFIRAAVKTARYFSCFFSRQYIFRAVEFPEIPAEPRVVLPFKTVRPKRAYILFIRPTAFTYFHNRLRNNRRLLRRHHTFLRNGQDCIPFSPDAGQAAPCLLHDLQILFPQIHASGNRG